MRPNSLKALLTALVALVATTLAAQTSGSCGDNLTWSFDTTTGELDISGSGAMTDYTSFGRNEAPWISYRSQITSIDLPVGLTRIGNHAFREFTNLTSVKIPYSVLSIGKYAFWGCTSLDLVEIFNGTESIEEAAFYGCKISLIDLPASLSSIGSNAFENSSLGFIRIHAENPTIGTNAFCSCSKLWRIQLWAFTPPAIDNTTFENTDLSEVTLDVPDGCTAAYEATLWQNVGIISYLAYGKCGDNLIWNVDEETSELIITGSGAMYDYTKTSNRHPWRSFYSVRLPEGITHIGDYAFYGCGSIHTIDIPSSVTSIGDFAFANTKLASLDIPEGVESIGEKAFYYCSSLTSVTIPGSVTNMGFGAFEYCSNLTTMKILGENPTFSEHEFNLCQKLQSFYMMASTPPDIDYSTFITSQYTVATLYVPAGCKAAYEAADVWKDFGNIKEYPWGKCGDNLTWELDTVSGVFTITGTGSMYGYVSGEHPWKNFRNPITSLNLPDGLTTIGSSAFAFCTGLTSISIPESVRTIASDAFRGCSNLVSVSLPEGLMSIQGNAFTNCSRLTSITIPESVTSISSQAFGGNTPLAEVTVLNPTPPSTSNDAFPTRASATLYVPAGCKAAYEAATGWKEFGSIEEYGISGQCGDNLKWTFYPATGLLSITGTGAMYDYTSSTRPWADYRSQITSISLPAGLTRISKYAFNNCKMQEVVIPDNVTFIGDGAFAFCSELQTVTLPKTPTEIQSRAFNGCNQLVSVKVNNPVPDAIDATVFSNRTNATLYVPAGSKEAYEAADYWTEFKEIIETGVSGQCGENLYWRFYSSTGELAITGTGAMYDYTPSDLAPWKELLDKITSLSLPDGLTHIGKYAFSNCVALATATIPQSVTSIGNFAFISCRSLTDIAIPQGVTILQPYTFRDCRELQNVSLAEGLTSIGTSAFAQCMSLTEIAIPQSVTSIKDYAFYACTELQNVSLAEGLTSIGDGTFTSCEKLSSITIPESVTSIGDFAFDGCESLTEAVCNSKLFAYLPPSFQGAYTIPSGIQTICGGAFTEHNGLTSVTLPRTVTSIGSFAFEGCRKLATVYANMPEAFTFGAEAFTDISYDSEHGQCRLYIPHGTKLDYINNGWTIEIFKYGVVDIDMGDVNCDGTVSITDVGLIIDYILGSRPSGFFEAPADMYNDGNITITDVGIVIDKILAQ